MKPPACPPPGEAAAVQTVIDALHAQMVADYPPGAMRRDAHPKAHGMVQAEVTVADDLPADLRAGVFAHPGRRYRAWIRFSNCFGIQPDLRADTRGMAVKLLGVDGQSFTPAQPGTQDFLAGSGDAFFIPDAIHYVGFPAAARAGGLALLRFFAKRSLWRGFGALRRSVGVMAANPLAISYFSQTAYRLGDDQVVKFQFRPVLSAPLGESLPWAPWFLTKIALANALFQFGDFTGLQSLALRLAALLGRPNLLHEALAHSLSTNDAWFAFLVQRRGDAMPVEDATASWDEAVAPFERVGWIRIPRQVFTPSQAATEAQRAAAQEVERLGENVSYNPWHAIAAHEPLGGINRARRRVNAASSDTRHQSNHVPAEAPAIADFDRLARLTRLEPGSVDPRPPHDPATFTSHWAYLYLRRVPILTALVLLLVPVFAVWIPSPISGGTRGWFDVEGPVLALVSLLASLNALTVMTTWWTITAYSDRRSRAKHQYAVYPIRPRWYVASLLLVLPIVASTFASVDRAGWTSRDWSINLGAWIAGAIAALAVARAVGWLAEYLGGLVPVQRWAKAIARWPDLGDGYVEGTPATFLPGHLFATGLALVTFGTYVTIGQQTTGRAMPDVPALVLMLLLPALACWTLSALTFFLDRFKVPTLAPLVVLLTLVTWLPGVRYAFALGPVLSDPGPSPTAVLNARAAAVPPSDRVVVVAASGGGTQSAAWTTRVLTGLMERCKVDGCAFDEAVRLISASSGGSVGAMIVADAYEDGRVTRSLAEMREASAASVQDALWRGLVYRDLFRPLRFWRRRPSVIDRGTALEDAWQSGLRNSATLGAWRDDALHGARPGVIFNATERVSGRTWMETHHDLLQISTAGTGAAAKSFADRYGGHDLPIVRAARLSASFPIVVPFARDDHGLRSSVILDGGYSDQFALDAVTGWLQAALSGDQQSARRVKRVLIVEARAPMPLQPPDLPTPDWINQLERDYRGVTILQQAWAGRVGVSSVAIRLCAASSIGWHATARERADIEQQWAALRDSDAVTAVMQFLRGDGEFASPTASVSKTTSCQ
jgi:hypothetical protein